MNGEKQDREEFAKILAGRKIGSADPSPGLTLRIQEAVSEEADRMEFAAILSGRQIKRLEPDESLSARIFAALDCERKAERGRAFRTRIFRYAVSAAAVAAVIVVVAAAIFPHYSGMPESRIVAVNSPREAAAGAGALPASSGDEADDALALADRAADWLVSCQKSDGTWSPGQTGGNEAFRPALTALAMMALQRHAPGRYADAVSRAACALVAMQQSDGSFSSAPSAKLYNHAFVSYALSDYSVAHGGAYSEALDRAIAFSLANQNDSGAWDYTTRDPGNTALTVWQAGFLLKARAAGWKDSGGHLRRSLAWLRRRAHNGTFDYRETLDRDYTPYSGSLTLTAMATATLLDASESFPELSNTALNAVDALRASCERMPDYSESGHYRDYFLCKVYTSRDDTESQRKIARQIIHNYSREKNAPAPWVAKDVWSATGGDLYATVMAMLSVNRGG